MQDLKRLLIPILILIGSGLVTKLLLTFFTGDILSIIIILIMAFSLFFFGFFLNKNAKKRNKGISKKIIAILLFVFILLLQLGWLNLPILDYLANLLDLDAFYVHMLYIFIGYLFGD